jgi:hypothetical protein
MILEQGIDDIPVEKPDKSGVFAVFGNPVMPNEVADRLSSNLYAQLADGTDETVREAITRAGIYVGAVLRRLNVPYNLDDKIVREVVLIHTVYELHIALGHEDAGKEYRVKARDIIRAAWGDFPESESAPEKSPACAVSLPKKNRRR